MTYQPFRKADTISIIAGEDLEKGDAVTIWNGMLIRTGGIYLSLLPRSYKKGEIVTLPWAGGF